MQAETVVALVVALAATVRAAAALIEALTAMRRKRHQRGQ